MRVFVRLLLATGASLVLVAATQAQNTTPGLSETDNSGPYFRGAFAIALPDFNPQPVNPGTQFGFTMALGYEFIPLLQAELEGSWAGGKTFESCSSCGDAGSFAILINARAFPLAVFEGTDDFPIQPYALAGMGGGGAEFSGLYQGAFIFNLGVGADLKMNDSVSVYGEVAHRFHAGDAPLGNVFKGITNFNFGIMKRF